MASLRLLSVLDMNIPQLLKVDLSLRLGGMAGQSHTRNKNCRNHFDAGRLILICLQWQGGGGSLALAA